MRCGMMPIFAAPGVMSPGQLAPSRRAAGWPRRKSLTRIMSWIGIPSVMHTMRVMPAAAASMMASGAKAGGTKMPDAVAPVAPTASATVLKTGTPTCVVPPLPGLVPPTRFVPICFICSAWKEPSRPVMPWTITRVVRSRRMLIRSRRRRGRARKLDDLLRSLPRVGPWLDAVGLEDLPPLLLARAAHAHDQRQLHLQVVARGDQSSRYLVATRDASEDVHQHAFDA